MRTVIKVLLWVILLAVVGIVAYVGHVWLSYSRLDDNLAIATDRNPAALMPAGKVLTAVTSNIGFGAYTDDFDFFMDGGTKARAVSGESVLATTNGMADAMLREDPELVLFQEVDIDSDRSHHINQADILTERLSDYGSVFTLNYHSAYLYYPLYEPIGQSNSGLLTMSKYQIESNVRRRFPIEENFNKLFDLDRCFTVSRLPTDNGRHLTLINLHMSAYIKDEAVQQAQVGMLMDALSAARANGDYVICGGDFNHDLWGGKSSEKFGFINPDMPWLAPFDEAALPEGFALVPSDNAPTVRDTAAAYVPGTTFVAIIDGFIVSDDVEVQSVETLDLAFRHTDHNPVKLTFQLTP